MTIIHTHAFKSMVLTLKRSMGSHLPYHNLNHVLRVTDRALYLFDTSNQKNIEDYDSTACNANQLDTVID